MKNYYFFLVSLLFIQQLSSQQSVSIRVVSADDDIEEYIAGPNQTKTPGTKDLGSSDLELGMETLNHVDPQLIGMRFVNVSIPKGALITKAYIQFTVDNTNKNTDPCNLYIFAEASDNSVPFNINELFNLANRQRLSDSVSWNIRPGSWTTIGEHGDEQKSTDISRLIQSIVDRSNWNTGNALSLFITGTGLREVESFDGSAPDAPLLYIEFIPVQTLSQRVNSPEDDIEEYLPGANQTKTPGSMDIGSSDLELGMETKDNIDPQYVGMRFTNINIPKGSLIKSAYIQFTNDNTNKNTDPTNLFVFAENSSNALAFNPNDPFNLTKRPVLSDSVSWNIPAGSWSVIGEKSADQQSSNLGSLVQQIVNQNDWTANNAIAFFIKGVGLREAEAYDGSAPDAPLLIVDYVPVTSAIFSVTSNEDDIEEYLPGANQTKTPGSMDLGSSDLELGMETANNMDPQYVGMRFTNITVPKSTKLIHAYLQFTVDNSNKNTDPCNLTIWAEKTGNSNAFNSSDPFNLTKRPVFQDSVIWNIPANSWKVIGEKAADQRSVDIAPLINQILDHADWNSGNALSIFIKGTGLREAESYDGSAPDAPKLILEYYQTQKPTLPVTTYPVKRKSDWNYWDASVAPSGNWTSANYPDNSWSFGPAPLGYGDPFIATKINSGADPNNKTISAYFRKTISITDLNTLAPFVECNLRADDGAVIYINGVEAFRTNMPNGAIDQSTKAPKRIVGYDELYYFVFDVPKSLFVQGNNIIAAEVHQWDGISSDLSFDLELTNQVYISNPSDLGCVNSSDDHISCFTSLLPRVQNELVEIPNTHAFQYITSTFEPYIGSTGITDSNFDFTGYVPINGSSTNGHISINHEKGPGGVSILDVELNAADKLWKITSSGPVDFSPVVLTAANCSGTVTPWNTVITCEETYVPVDLDANADGYYDLGWAVEIDPKTRKVKDYGNGPEKLWSLGRMSHENVVVKNDNKTLYEGEDASDGNVYKFIADEEGNLSKGKLYVLKLNGNYVNGEPSDSTGVWLEVPNTTKSERNDVKIWAAQNRATAFAGVEDLEISPLNGDIYFTVKGVGRVYRFKDEGTTISGFETFVGNRSYRINSNNRIVSEAWAQGNDNLTFDDRGNLWVLQDGGLNLVWVVRPDHTQANPKVELFMLTPIGSEPTGMTFSPDYKYMFISIQEPSAANTQTMKDVSGKDVRFNKSTCLVLARKENLGGTVSTQKASDENFALEVTENPFTRKTQLHIELKQEAKVNYAISNAQGKTLYHSGSFKLQTGKHLREIDIKESGIFYLTVYINDEKKTLILFSL